MEPLYKLVDGERVEFTQADYDQMQIDADAAQLEAERAQALALTEYMHSFRDMRRELLNALTGIAIAEDMLDEFKVAREALLNIPQIPAVANATNAAEAKAACKIAYMAVVAASPPEFILAFKELNG